MGVRNWSFIRGVKVYPGPRGVPTDIYRNSLWSAVLERFPGAHFEMNQDGLLTWDEEQLVDHFTLIDALNAAYQEKW